VRTPILKSVAARRKLYLTILAVVPRIVNRRNPPVDAYVLR
jgi:hypothetical protein